MEDSEFYSLSSSVKVLQAALNKDIEHIKEAQESLTKDYLHEKRYKDWRLWLGGFAVIMSLLFSGFNAYQMHFGGKNVPSDHKK